MKHNIPIAVAIAMFLCCTVACQEEKFSQEAYQQLVESSFPTDSIDSQHDWRLTTRHTLYVTPLGLEGTTCIRLLSANPYSGDQIELLAEQPAKADTTVALNSLLPKVQEELCVAAMNDSGHILALQTIAATQHICELTSTDAPLQSTNYNLITAQRVYYLYEADFPRPGDWDYNDIVLTVDVAQNVRPSADVSNDLAARQRRLRVTLQAVGYNRQLAAAIRLIGLRRADVESITTSSYEGMGFQRTEGYPRSIIKDEELLLTAQSGEAVINLFDDAHLAIYPQLTESAQPYRYLFNVKHTTDDAYSVSPAAEVDYVITFRDVQTAGSFSIADIDPFIVAPFNGANWEIHSYRYRTEQTLFNYVTAGKENFRTGYSWCLEVPYRWFRYPEEGQPMGRLHEGKESGAYTINGHSYLQWVLNRNNSLDWYRYPLTPLVY